MMKWLQSKLCSEWLQNVMCSIGLHKWGRESWIGCKPCEREHGKEYDPKVCMHCRTSRKDAVEH